MTQNQFEKATELQKVIAAKKNNLENCKASLKDHLSNPSYTKIELRNCNSMYMPSKYAETVFRTMIQDLQIEIVSLEHEFLKL